MKNNELFKQFMATIGELFDKEITVVLSDVYWKALENFDDEQCAKAFNVVILSSRFFPKPVDLIEAIRGTRRDMATDAWLEVLETVKRIGNYQSVKFDDMVIHSVIQAMGGWPELCMMETDDIKWKQKEFERLYEVMAGRDGKHPDYLPGTCEMENFRTGFNVENNIVKIGYNSRRIKLLQ